jgi:D-arabinose 1-dehydrogenase-like Zn-dependent alcohol dehydrogenase
MWPHPVAHDCDNADACATDAAVAERAPRAFGDEDDQGFLRKAARSPNRTLRNATETARKASVIYDDPAHRRGYQVKAAVLHAQSEHGDIRLEEIPVPEPGPNELLVKVAACGVCGHDQSDRQGLTRPGELPLVIGHEVSGTVAAVGERVQGFEVGDRVASKQQTWCGWCPQCKAGRHFECAQSGFNHGGWAEFVTLSAGCMLPVPDSVDLEDASIVACAVGTTLNALRGAGQLIPGQTVLNTGAGGGLGLHGLQVAKALGARSIALTSSPSKVEPLMELGADDVVLADGKDYWKAILEATGGQGPDIVIDNVGHPDVFAACYRALKAGGRYVFTGQLYRAKVEVYPAFIFGRGGGATITGSGPGGMAEFLDAMTLVEEGKVTPVLDKMSLDDVVEATHRQDSSQMFGRLTLIP